MVLKGKVAVVTGSGQGLGKAIAIGLAEAGAKVVVNNRSPETKGGTAEETAKLIRDAGGEAIPVYGSVAQMDICEKLIKTAIDRWGSIDILVNNAGLNRDRMVWNMSEEEWDTVVGVILKGTFGCTRFAAASMREQRKGRIINIASQFAFKVAPGMGAYSVAKAGVVMLTRVLAQELGRFGIRTNTVAPAMVRTEFSRHTWNDPEALKKVETSLPLGRVAETTDLVGAVLLLASDASSYITGHTILIDGGALA